MRFRVGQAALLNELQFLQGIAEKKKTIPILSNILLRAKEGWLTLAATDLEVSLTAGCESAVEASGGITVSAKKLFEVVRSLPEEEIEVALEEGNWLELRCGKAQFRLVGLPPEDFPEVPEMDFSGAVKLNYRGFKELIGRTIFAVTREDARYALNGALLEMAGGTVRMVATDSHRLAVVESKLEEDSLEVRVIVPRKTLVELRSLGNGEELLFGQDEHHLFFNIGHRTLASRVIEGQFPAYEKVIPVDNPVEARFQTEEMSAALRRVSLLASERSRAVKFSFSKNEAVVESSNPELGEAKESVTITYNGEEMQISFNAQYLLDFLASVGTDSIVLHLKDPASQALFLPAKEAREKSLYQYVVMPMRT
ncbi:MAG: DNA polymerase III subunit beta [Acidobacteriota bacterium]